MNELVIRGKQEFLGSVILVVEGGFGESKRCILAKDIAFSHDIEVKEVNRKINDNIDEFEVGVDLIDLKTSGDSSPVLMELGFTQAQIGNANNIYLLSESGYMTLCMFMKTKIAKEKRKQFKKEYFAMREVIKSDEQLKKELAYKLLNGGIDSIEAHKQLVAIETKPLVETIEKQKPMVELCLKRRSSEGLVTITDMKDVYSLKQGQLGTFLKEQGYIHRSRQEVNTKGKGLFQVYGEEYSSIGITEDGVLFINSHIDEIRKSPCRLSKKAA